MLNAVITGLGLGCIYGLVAMGFTLVYRTTGIMNFAQGAPVMLSGLSAGWAIEAHGWSLWPAAALGLVVGTASGVLLAVLVVIPLWRRRAAEYVVVLGTLLYLLAAENFALNLMGSDPRSVPPILGGSVASIGGRSIRLQECLIVVVAIVLAVLLERFLVDTATGRAMRAAADDREIAAMAGVSITRIAVIAMALAALIGAVGGVLIAPIQLSAYNVAHAYNIMGFLAAVLGGLAIRWALVAGVVVGVTESLVGVYVSSSYLQLILLGLLLLILLGNSGGLRKTKIRTA